MEDELVPEEAEAENGQKLSLVEVVGDRRFAKATETFFAAVGLDSIICRGSLRKDEDRD